MILLLNYAHGSHMRSQKNNTTTGLAIGGCNRAAECRIWDIDDDFIKKNHKIFDNPRGAGYWIWKPYLILKYLHTLKTGDYLFYSDSGAVFVDSVQYLVELNQDITLFNVDPVPGNTESAQTKRDCFVIMNADRDEYINSTPRHGGFQLYKKCPASINFVNEYLEYCQDERLVTDQDNVMGKPNYPNFKAHRHDQSILSLLSKIYEIPSFRDPTQYGNPYIQPGEYPQIINHTRSPE